MMRPITLTEFEMRFRQDPDPWQTHTRRREKVKRHQLMQAAGFRRWSRALELGAGNGSNTVLLARRSLQLDACEATDSGFALIQEAVASLPNVQVCKHVIPERFPSSFYDLIVISEVLYYLPPGHLRKLSRAISRALVPGGRLVLAHHHRRFADAWLGGATAQENLIRAISAPLRPVFLRRNHLWIVAGWDRAVRLPRSLSAAAPPPGTIPGCGR